MYKIFLTYLACVFIVDGHSDPTQSSYTPSDNIPAITDIKKEFTQIYLGTRHLTNLYVLGKNGNEICPVDYLKRNLFTPFGKNTKFLASLVENKTCGPVYYWQLRTPGSTLPVHVGHIFIIENIKGAAVCVSEGGNVAVVTKKSESARKLLGRSLGHGIECQPIPNLKEFQEHIAKKYPKGRN